MKFKQLITAVLLISIVGVYAFTPDDLEGEKVLVPAYETADGEVNLVLPSIPYNYEGIEVPDHYFRNAEMFGLDAMNVESQGWEQANFFSDEGATLGRVLFYDRNLSINRTVSCGSCHAQENGFAEAKTVSEGFNGMLGRRNALNIAEVGFSPYLDLLWDDRSSTLEEMVLLPLEDGDEMGITLDQLTARLQTLDYYAPLFQSAYGTTTVTPELIGKAMAEFIRTLLPLNSKLDEGVANDFQGWTEQELKGKLVFQKDCQGCHSSVVTTSNPWEVDEVIFNSLEGGIDDINVFLFPTTEKMFMFQGPHNTGLDLEYADSGMADWTNSNIDEGVFKTPNIKNIELTAPYMHDGRFETLEEIVDFYSDEIEPHANSHFKNNDFIYEDFPPGGDPEPEDSVDFKGFEYTDVEKVALVAFLRTLTDDTFNANEIYSDPFVYEGAVGINDLNLLEMSVVPNPVRSTATLSLDAAFENMETTIVVMDLAGKTIWSDKTRNRTYSFERGELPAGTYILEARAENLRSSEKLLIK